MELEALIRGAVAGASRNRMNGILEAAPPPFAGAFSEGGIGSQPAPAGSNLWRAAKRDSGRPARRGQAPA